jgi:hypothetical protein
MYKRHENDYVLYEKRGRRYFPVKEYDGKVHDAFPQGFALVHTQPGSTSIRYTVDPDMVAVEAALKLCEDKIHDYIREATKSRPEPKPVTLRAQELWKELDKELGDNLLRVWGCSQQDIVEAMTKAVKEYIRESNDRHGRVV